MGPQVKQLDERRLHLQHGPIDLIVEAFGETQEVEKSYRQAWQRFQTLLTELVEELPCLKMPWKELGLELEGKVAQRMGAAVAPLGGRDFVTPMAAVAGSVADEILQSMLQGVRLERAYVNNGGDIALHLNPGAVFDVGLVPLPDAVDSDAQLSVNGKLHLHAGLPVRGIATSGRGGRSLSLGIADSVTVLAKNAASADVAATLIANRVDLPGHLAITRQRASDLDPDSDLGDQRVTTSVGTLSFTEVNQALKRGEEFAHELCQRGDIVAACLCLNGQVITCGDLMEKELPGWAPEELTPEHLTSVTN